MFTPLLGDKLMVVNMYGGRELTRLCLVCFFNVCCQDYTKSIKLKKGSYKLKFALVGNELKGV
jgi:hypothetical protein